MTEKPQGLVSALAQIQSEMPIVHKGMTAKIEKKTGGSFSYSYTDLADIVKTVYPLLGKVGLAFITAPRFMENRYVLVGSLEHESGESRSADFPLPERATPQELGSAITYGRRYLLGCLTGIVTGDQDDDGAAASARPREAQRPAQPHSGRDWRAEANKVTSSEALRQIWRDAKGYGELDEQLAAVLTELVECMTAVEAQDADTLPVVVTA